MDFVITRGEKHQHDTISLKVNRSFIFLGTRDSVFIVYLSQLSFCNSLALLIVTRELMLVGRIELFRGD